MTHRWHWRKWMPERHGQLCRVLAVGRENRNGLLGHLAADEGMRRMERRQREERT